MKKWTVWCYTEVCKEWWNVEAETAEDAIALITNNPERPEPDSRHTLKETDFDAEEEARSYQEKYS